MSELAYVINTSTNTVIAAVTAGLEPWGVAFSPDGTLAYVTNYASNTISVVDTSTSLVINTIGGLGNPIGVAFNPAGTVAYAANFGGNTVSVIDVSTHTVTATITSTIKPDGIAVSPDGTLLYVAGINDCYVVNTSTNAIIHTISVGDGVSSCVAFNPSGAYAYIGSSGIAVIDVATHGIVASISESIGQISLAVNPAGTYVYAVGSYQVDYAYSTIYVLNTATNTITDTFNIAGNAASGIAFSTDGTLVYVCDNYNATLAVIDVSTSLVTHTIDIGMQPNGVAVSPTALLAYVTSWQPSENAVETDEEDAGISETDLVFPSPFHEEDAAISETFTIISSSAAGFPTAAEVETLEYFFNGKPSTPIPASSTVKLFTLEYLLNGQPLIGNPSTFIPAPLLVTDEEDFAIDESEMISAVVIEEDMSVAEEWSIDVTTAQEDDLATSDDSQAGPFAQGEEDLSVGEDWTVAVTVPIEEDLAIKETDIVTQPVPPQEEDFAVDDEFTIIEVYTFNATCQVQVGVNATEEMGTVLNLLQDTHVPVTSLTSVLNPMQPTLIVNGTPVVINGSTAPAGDYTQTSSFVSYLASGLPSCKLFNFNISLNTGGGGSWSFISQDDLFTLGETINLFGLQATITHYGPIVSDSYTGEEDSGYVAWSASGIFGPTTLDKQIVLVGRQNPTLAPLLPTQLLQQPPSSSWATVSACAKAIAEAAGMSLTWSAADAPMVDMFPESGITVAAALQSLAQRVQGVIGWDGYQGYHVVDPIHGYGNFEAPPTCSMIGAAGVESISNYNLQNGVVYLPVNLIYAGSYAVAPNSLTKQPQTVYQLATSTTPLADPTPAMLIDKPGDYNIIGQSAKIQIIVDPSNTSAIGNQYVVTDNSIWYDIALPIVTTSYLDNTSGNIITTTKLQIPNIVYPEGISNFTMNVGYVRNTAPLIAANSEAVSQSIQKQQMLAASQLAAMQYFKTVSSTINTFFYGVVPLPGQQIVFNFGVISITGIIESVSISSPGLMTLTIGTYVLTNMITATSTISAATAGSGGV